MKTYLDETGLALLWAKIKDQDSKWTTKAGEAIDNLSQAVTEGMAKKQDTLVSGTNIKTINGKSILGSGDIGIDFSLYKLVTELPTSNIDITKIYILLNSSSTETVNQYTEYIYLNNAWEKIGEFKDLSGFAIKSDTVSGVELDSVGASKTDIVITLNTIYADSTVKGVDINLIPATTESAGLLSATDKSSLETLKTQWAYADSINDELLNSIWFNLDGENKASHVISISGSTESYPGAKGFYFDPNVFSISYDSAREVSYSPDNEHYVDTIKVMLQDNVLPSAISTDTINAICV